MYQEDGKWKLPSKSWQQVDQELIVAGAIVEAKHSSATLALANSVASVTSGATHSCSNSFSLDGKSVAGNAVASMGRNEQGRDAEAATQRQQRMQSQTKYTKTIHNRRWSSSIFCQCF